MCGCASRGRGLCAALPRTGAEARVLDLGSVISLDGRAIRRDGQSLSLLVLSANDDRGASDLPAGLTLDVVLDSGTTVAVRRVSWNRTALLGSLVVFVLELARVETMLGSLPGSPR